MRFSLRILLIATFVLALCAAGFGWVRHELTSKLPEVVTSTRIAGTEVVVQLHGPDMKRHYFYDIILGDGNKKRRFLGPIVDESLEPVLVEEAGDGNIRVQWGTLPHAGFCILNLDEGVVVRDSNRANPSNEPFVPPPTIPVK